MGDLHDMDPHVSAGIYGTPKINPDEQRHYLGTFRERVYVAQTVETFADPQYLPTWLDQMQAHPDAILLLNGNLESDDLSVYMKLASKAQVGFTLKTDATYSTDDTAIAAVLTAREAVNIDQVDITKLADITINKNDKSDDLSHEKSLGNWFTRLFKS